MADGPALSLSGSAGLGLTFTGEEENAAGTTINESKVDFEHFAKVTFKGAGVTDGGLSFGMKVRVNGGNTGKVDDAEVHIGGESWTVTVGDNDSASDLAFTLGDVGFDGNLGVDDIAEKAHKRPEGYTDSQARVDLTFGVATVAVSVGQTPGTARVGGKAGTAENWSHYIEYDPVTPSGGTDAGTPRIKVSFVTYTGAGTSLTETVNGVTYASSNGGTFTVREHNFSATTEATAVAEEYTGSGGLDRFYRIGNDVYRVMGNPDRWYNPTDGDPTSVLGADTAENVDDVPDVKIAELDGTGDDNTVNLVAGSTRYNPKVDATPAKPATKQESNWSLGTSVDLGVAKLGFGLDSEKKMSVSVSGDFGMVGGGLYYSQQDVDMMDSTGKVVREDKWTGLGAQVNVGVGDGTTVTVVGTQRDMDTMGKQDAFGVGVNHDLGGGATVQAGFAQVNDINKASAGIVMSF